MGIKKSFKRELYKQFEVEITKSPTSDKGDRKRLPIIWAPIKKPLPRLKKKDPGLSNKNLGPKWGKPGAWKTWKSISGAGGDITGDRHETNGRTLAGSKFTGRGKSSFPHIFNRGLKDIYSVIEKRPSYGGGGEKKKN